MPDDDANDGEKHTATTVPPPAGEDDIYDAKTQVGGLPPEALAMLRAIRDEAPPTGGTGKEANVPVFVDDEPPVSKPRPAAGMPAPRPAAGMLPTPLMVPLSPNPSAPSEAPASSAPRRSSPASSPGSDPPPVFSARGAPPPAKIPSAEVPSAEPESYGAVFAPLPPSIAPPSPSPETAPGASSGPSPLLIFGGFVLLAVLIVIFAQMGLIPGLRPPVPSAPAPAVPS